MVRCASTHCPLPSQERSFETNEELMEHAQETRGLHPLCIACERVFRDRESYVQHMDAKHAIYCAKCSRKYHSPSALEQHFRASAHHPNCPRCGAGMENRDAVTRHIAEEHPKVRCCGVQMFKDELPGHYLNSMNHPQCLECNAGFESQPELDEHRAEAHPEVVCLICNRDFATRDELEQHERAPGTHPRCEFCNNAFKDTSSLIEHFSTTHLLEHLGLLAMKSATIAPSSLPPTPQKATSSSTSGSSTSPRAYSRAVGSERTASRIFPAMPTPTSPPTRLQPPAHAPAPTPPPPIAHDKKPVLTYASPPSSNGGSGAATPLVFPTARAHDLLAATHRLAHTPSPSRSSFAETPSGDLSDFRLLKGSPSPSPRVVGLPVQRERAGAGLGDIGDMGVVQSPMRTPMPARAAHDGRSSSSYVRAGGSAHAGDAAAASYARANGGSGGYSTVNGYPTPNADAYPGVHRDGFASRSADAQLNGKRRSDTLTTLVAQRSPSPPAHVPAPASAFFCRLCRADPCVEVTATACGHVFCNQCIVAEVKRTACCPVCSSAVLLFALLKLRVWE